MALVTPLPQLSGAPDAKSEPAGGIYSDAQTMCYLRSPHDVLRFVVYGVAALVLLALARWATDSLLGLEEDVIRLLTFLSPVVERMLAGALTVAIVVSTLAIWITPIITRRYRLFGYIVVTEVAVALLVGLGSWWVDRPSAVLANELATRAGVDTGPIASEAAMGQLAALFVVMSPFVTRRWRRAGAIAFGFIALVRLVTAAQLPADLGFAVAAGGAVGTLVLFVFGRPDHRATNEQVVLALRGSGVPIADLDHAAVDARGSTPYFGRLDDGRRIFAKVLGDEERSADLLFRLYRFLRFRNLDDEKPFSTLRRAVEHEAYIALQARDVGIRTPRMLAIASVAGDSYLLTYERIEGGTLDKIDPALVDDALLDGIWQELATLHRHRIAHRDLRRANILVDPEGRPWLIDFGFAEVAASDRLLASDIAQALAALAVICGAERTVDAAIRALGPDVVGASLPRLQMGALSGATQTALREQKGLLNSLQSVVKERTGRGDIEYEPIQRLSVRQLLTVVMLIGVVYLLLPQFADLPEIWSNVKTADWWWMPPMLVASAITYIGATFSFMGAIPDRLPFSPTLATQTGSSFVSKVAPAGLGGMALNVRYAQKSGVDPAVAVSGVGLNSIGGLLVHIVLTIVFMVWAGRQAFDDLRLPDPKYFVYGIIAVAVLAAVMMVVPSLRRLVITKLLPILRRSFRGIGAVLRSPSKVLLLLGGSAIVTLSYVVCIYFATNAFGGDLPFATVGAAYLIGAAIATAAPTPGGLGAVEAALIAGLTASGMDSSAAVPAVFLYRLTTFWIPILPGWAAFTWLKRSDYI